jgi:hypothetical protein
MAGMSEPPKYRLVTAQQLAKGYLKGPGYGEQMGWCRFTVVESHEDGTATVLDPAWEEWNARRLGVESESAAR